jgi:hypothetical protein
MFDSDTAIMKSGQSKKPSLWKHSKQTNLRVLAQKALGGILSRGSALSQKSVGLKTTCVMTSALHRSNMNDAQAPTVELESAKACLRL